MEEFNKFKVLTVAIILMFIFAVAAIYTNTKEASVDKGDNKNIEERANLENRKQYDSQEVSKSIGRIEELGDELSRLNDRVNDITDKLNSFENSTCHIYGIMTDNGPEQYSAREALSNAQENGLDIVLSCRF